MELTVHGKNTLVIGYTFTTTMASQWLSRIGNRAVRYTTKKEHSRGWPCSISRERFVATDEICIKGVLGCFSKQVIYFVSNL